MFNISYNRIANFDVVILRFKYINSVKYFCFLHYIVGTKLSNYQKETLKRKEEGNTKKKEETFLKKKHAKETVKKNEEANTAKKKEGNFFIKKIGRKHSKNEERNTEKKKKETLNERKEVNFL